jgi:quercetin dioxygenase-like cupin family protein
MRTTLCVAIMALLALLSGTLPTARATAGSETPDPAAASHATESGLILENLLKAQLDRIEGTEVIVSRVTIPPHTSLPKHWHPGEEFGYVLEGSAILWQEGKEEIVVNAGEVVKIPLEQVHTAITQDEGATILVFRVHEEGKPERFPAE